MKADIPNIGNARSTLEVDYFLELQGCPQCGERDIGTPSFRAYTTATKTHICDVTCPNCGRKRSILYNETDEYRRNGSVMKPMPYGHLGGPLPSQIIPAWWFAKELARCVDQLPIGTRGDVGTLLRIRSISHEMDPLHGGEQCSIELAKFLSDSSDEIPAAFFLTDEARAYRTANHEQFSRAYIAKYQEHFQRLGAEIRQTVKEEDARRAPGPAKPLPLPPFSLAALAFHERWVASGDGPERQRMTARGADATARSLSRRNLSSVILEKVTLDRADLSNTTLQYAELTDVSARDSSWTHATLVETTLRRCNFSRSTMTSALLHHSTIEQCDFANTQLASSSFVKAEVKASVFVDADLSDARLSEASFTDCDVRGAKLAASPRESDLTDVTFIRCDLRNTDWRGRKLVRATFVDCKIAGARGAVLEDATFTRTDVSVDGDGSAIATRDDAIKIIAASA